jgi:hypothetical protein
MNPLIQFKKTTPLFLVVSVLGCFGLSPGVRATDLDGVLPGGNNADGFRVLTNLTTGGFNTGAGWFSLFSNQGGSFNTAFGAATLFSNTADQNTATGAGALFSNTTGVGNTATGAFALLDNTVGNYNTANGQLALFTNSTGVQNTASGVNALKSNTTGSNNTASGVNALSNNANGVENTANGVNTLFNNTTGGDNTAIGFRALFTNTGVSNTATGASALDSNTTGDANTAIGAGALLNNTTGFSNTALGFEAGINVNTANHVICIGADGQDVSNSTWMGHVFGVTTQSATTAPVIVSDTGQLGTVASSERFKKDIVNMDKTSETILSLRPVTFHYKTDAKGIPQFGLIAEEVAKVNPALVLPDKEGKPYTVRYDQVNAMLLNEFLKERKKVEAQQSKIEKQEAIIAQLKSAVAQQEATAEQQEKRFQSSLAEQDKQIEALASGLQKVSAQVEVTKFAPGRIRRGGPTPQVIVTNQ